MKLNLPYVKIDDPSHGWLRVPVTDLNKVGAALQDFSRYSYRDSRFVYLEEDCDMGVFCEKFQKATGRPLVSEDIQTQHMDNCFIRNLPDIW